MIGNFEKPIQEPNIEIMSQNENIEEMQMIQASSLVIENAHIVPTIER